MIWEDLRNPNDPKLDELATQHHLHPLHVEDCRHRNQNAKVEHGEGYLFIVLKAMDLLSDGCLRVSDVDIFLGPDYIISVQEAHCETARMILDSIHEKNQQQRADKLAYQIMDVIVDSYVPMLDKLDDRIDALEDEVLQNPHPSLLQKIFDVKRTLLELRRNLVNTRDVANHLIRIDDQLIAPDLQPFLRDVYDHVARNLDLVETQRDLLSGSLDIYLSSVANRTNEVMRVLTVLSTIALPAIVVSGIYGMNFEGIPFMKSPHAPLVIFSVMIATTTGLLVFFRRRHYW